MIRLIFYLIIGWEKKLFERPKELFPNNYIRVNVLVFYSYPSVKLVHGGLFIAWTLVPVANVYTHLGPHRPTWGLSVACHANLCWEHASAFLCSLTISIRVELMSGLPVLEL